MALANKLYVEHYLQTQRLVVPFDIKLITGRGFFLVYPADRSDQPAVAAFRDWLLTQPTLHSLR